MALDLASFLEDVSSAQALDDLHRLSLDLKDRLAAAHVVYHWVSADGEQYGCGSYPLGWVQHYIEKDYLRIDPVVLECFQRFHPVDWSRLDWSSRAAKALRKDAIAHGIGSQGLSIPIRGPQGQFAVFTVTDDCADEAWQAFIAGHQRDLILIAHYFNRKALDIRGERAPEPIRALSPRELDTLTYLAMGYARGQVAEMLGISEHTLRAYVESARFKLGAVNTIHAVSRALAEGLILTGGAARSADGTWPGRELHLAAQAATAAE